MIESVPVFVGLTLVFMGGCAFMTGQALAATWRPMGLAVPYGLLLGVADRFLAFALFGGALLSPAAFALDAGILVTIALAAYRMTQAKKMVDQYPWIYERDGLFGWRDRGVHHR